MLDEAQARRLLAAAYDGDREGIRSALAKLADGLRGYVFKLLTPGGSFSRMAQRARVEAADVASHTMLKLLTTPPDRHDNDRPIATLLAWVKLTVKRVLLDALETAKRRLAVAVVDDLPSGAPSPEREAQARNLLHRTQAMLRECYPKGLELLGTELGSDTDDDESLARHLGTSVADVQKRRSRMKQHSRAYRALSELPAATDEVVAREMQAALNADARDIVRRVRLYVRRERAKEGGTQC